MSKRLQIFKDSLTKKENLFSDKLDTHMATVKQSNGQPLNDKRNGAATLNKWEKQNESLRNIDASIQKTKEAIEREESKVAQVEDAKQTLPAEILRMIETGELIQWRKHPYKFFVPGVEKGRITWNPKNETLAHSYTRSITDKEQYKKFAQVYNALYNPLKK